MGLITNPRMIEQKSFEIISELLKNNEPLGEYASVIKRVIHTTADFDYLESLAFSDGVLEHARVALLQGANVVTDTQMAKAGINKKTLGQLNGTVHCFIDSEKVAVLAKARDVTRAAVAMQYAVQHLAAPLIFVIGNAPTALLQLHELITQGTCKPALVIGVPVGFVNVVESKESIMQLDIPYIVARGRKGGSNVAAAILNAIIYDLTEKETGNSSP